MFSSAMEGERPARMGLAGRWKGEGGGGPDSTRACTRARSPSAAAVQMFMLGWRRREGVVGAQEVCSFPSLLTSYVFLVETALAGVSTLAGLEGTYDLAAA